MAKRPTYGKILRQSRFPTRAEAEEFAKEMKEEYKMADLSLRYDVSREESGEWTATVFMKT